ncbi:MAG: hypothetical protein ACR2PL_12210 [Dehalococcoidia bacterium]
MEPDAPTDDDLSLLEGLIEVNDPSEIPTFASEEEEMTFWDTRRLGDAFPYSTEQISDDELSPVDATRLA